MNLTKFFDAAIPDNTYGRLILVFDDKNIDLKRVNRFTQMLPPGKLSALSSKLVDGLYSVKKWLRSSILQN